MNRHETRLKVALRELGVSQAELSRRTGVDVVQVNRWCQGVYRPVDETKRLIASALGRPVGELFDGVHDGEVPMPAGASDENERNEMAA